MTETIAQTLGAKDGLAEHISERELLLLLDNLEQVVECAPELSALLQSCPNLTLLVTSRELLRIQGEVEYAVPPLAARLAAAGELHYSRLTPEGMFLDDEVRASIETAKATSDPRIWQEAWTTGSAMSLDEATDDSQLVET